MSGRVWSKQGRKTEPGCVKGWGRGEGRARKLGDQETQKGLVAKMAERLCREEQLGDGQPLGRRA